MALKLNERYPGRFDNPSADYPQGSFKNRTTPTAKDGSYLEKDWANDKEGFFQSLIAAAGITPSGDVDKVGASQFYDALVQVVGDTATGRLLSIKVITASGTYTKTTGTTKIRVRGVAPGGGGGGTAATSASQSAAGGGGGAGAFGEGLYDATGFTTQTVTMGAPGVGAAGAAGTNATSSSFGSLMTLPGGLGGGLGVAQSSFSNAGGNGANPTSSPTGANIFGSPGDGGSTGAAYQTSSSTAGIGGKSPFGATALLAAVSGFGCGGSGARSTASAGANNGFSGGPGLFIVEEYA